MCSIIRPSPKATRSSFVRIRHFWKAPISSSHHEDCLGHLLTPLLRSGDSECARIFAPVPGPIVLVSCK